jgi:ferredoxin
MPGKNKQILICNCENTMRVEGDAIGRALGENPLIVRKNLCRSEISQFESALDAGQPICVACTQESPLFSEIAAEREREDPLYVNIREMAGWTADKRDATPKIAALLASASLESAAPTRSKAIVSDGLCLVYGSGQAAFDAARLLNGRLSVTLVLKDASGIVLPPVLDIPVFSGTVNHAAGTLGSFEIAVDGYAAMLPSSRGNLQFAMRRDGAKSKCSVIVDLSGDAPLFPRSEGRDGYFRADPGDPVAISSTLFKAGDYVGEFEKPIYVTYDAALCAHARSQKTGCTKCIDNCPTGAIQPSGDNIEINTAICGGCGNCAAHCPTGAAQYQYPRSGDLISKIQTLASVYLEAGGTEPVLLLHDGEHGLQTINIMARFMRGLPANVIPLEMHSVTALGHETIIATLLAGFRNIVVVADPKKLDEIYTLEQEINLVDALLEGLEITANRISMLKEIDPEIVEKHLWRLALAPQIARKSFTPVGNKREVARAAIGLLANVSPSATELIPLPQSAPYGQVVVDTEACTLCMACVSACPTDAMRDTPETPELRFVENACVQCGLCKKTCPENAITLETRLNLTPTAMQAVTLYSEEPFECTRCGKPFVSRSMIERVAEKLGGKHWMFESDERIALLKMCDSCRLEVLAEKDDDPFAIAARPRTRTTDDYVAAEKSGLSIDDFIKGD